MNLITGLKLVGAVALGALAVTAVVKLSADNAAGSKSSDGLSLLAGRALLARHVGKINETLSRKPDLFDYDPVAKAYFEDINTARKKEKDLTFPEVASLLKKCDYIKIHVLDVA